MKRALAVVGSAAVVALAIVGLLTLATGVLEDDASSATGAAAPVEPGVINRIYDSASPGVVFIQAEVVPRQRAPIGPRPRRSVSTGTGFVIDDEGRILTNAHVVEDARRVRVRFSESELVDATVTGRDAANDLALLKVGRSVARR